MNDFLHCSDEISIALANGAPLVALESTIISHGMPYPRNVETAQSVERIVRDQGAIPATIAILEGKIRVGLSANEIEQLGKLGTRATKVSRRDLPWVLSQKIPGATTVAATMIAADQAGIQVFATGGIGGVHRGGQDSLDISADLQELARTSVAVICAGAKSILDLPRTLEYLETHGVPVLGFQTQEFPAFFCRSSGLTCDFRMDEVTAIARFLRTKWSIPLPGGVVIANPIPTAFEPDFASVQEAIEQSLAEAEQQGVAGKALTPFLLSRIEQLTHGKSLDANIKLVLNNARLAADLAVALARRR